MSLLAVKPAAQSIFAHPQASAPAVAFSNYETAGSLAFGNYETAGSLASSSSSSSASSGGSVSCYA